MSFIYNERQGENLESYKLYENINEKTLQSKFTIVEQFKLKLVDYIESELIFQDEKTLEEEGNTHESHCIAQRHAGRRLPGSDLGHYGRRRVPDL